jgi:glycosyltransferase involved in cell wall biosynthesis
MEPSTGRDPEIEIRVANFMDSRLEDLHVKGNLAAAPEIYNLNRALNKVIHFSPYPGDAVYAAQLAAGGIDLVCYDPRPSHPLRAAAAVLRIFRIMRRERINVVRGRLPYAGSLIGCALGRLLGIPSIVSLGGDNRLPQELNGRYYFGSRALSFAMESLVLRLCDRIIVPNRFTQAYVARIIGARGARKCAIIPWAVDEAPPTSLDEAALRRRFALPADALLVPVIGFLNRYKYTDRLFGALDGWPAPGNRPIVFLFCGDGPLRGEGETRFAGRPDIRFLGWQERPIAHALIRAASFVMVPMSGLVLLEAASAAKPVITSRVEWHSELVEDGVGGMLVEPTDPADWRRAIAEMVLHPDTADAMGRALHQRYLANYRPERARALEIALYRELVGAKGAASARSMASGIAARPSGGPPA